MKRFWLIIIFLILCFDIIRRIKEAYRDEQNRLPTPHPKPNLNQNSNKSSIIIPLSLEKEGRGSYSTSRLNFPIQFSSEDTNLSVIPRMRSSVTWINCLLYIDLTKKPFDCSELETCQLQGETRFSDDGQQIGGILVKEKMKLAGHTLPNIDVTMATGIISGRLKSFQGGLESVLGVIGLGFKRENPNIPPLLDYLKTQNLIETPIFSVQLEENGGELTLGGYDENQISNGLNIVKLNQGNEFPEFSMPVKTLGLKTKGKSFKSTRHKVDGYNVVLDFEYPWIDIPEWLGNELDDERSEVGLYPMEGEWPPELPDWGPSGQVAAGCAERGALPDLEIAVDGFMIKIPSSLYISESKGYFVNGTESKVKGCFWNLHMMDRKSKNIVLGRPFFEAYYTVFDYENKTVGFSQKFASEDPDVSLNYSYIFMALFGVINFLIFGFCFWFRVGAFKKPFVAFTGEGKTFGESPSIIVESLPYPHQGFTQLDQTEKYPQE